MHIKLPSTYPYSRSQLASDNLGTSFPESMPDERLAEWGVFPVSATAQPIPAPGEIVEELTPVELGGVWTQQWLVRAATQQETDRKAADVRAERGSLLSACDWTQVDDSPLSNVQKAAWATYRQALRDISAQSGFPWTIDWPVTP